LSSKGDARIVAQGRIFARLTRRQLAYPWARMHQNRTIVVARKLLAPHLLAAADLVFDGGADTFDDVLILGLPILLELVLWDFRENMTVALRLCFVGRGMNR